MEALLQVLLVDPHFEVNLVVSGAHLLIESGYSIRAIERRYQIAARIPTIVAGDSLESMSESVAFGMSKFNSVFARLQPEMVLIHGDRFDALSAALASSLQKIFTVHIEGGELSGTADGAIRHAITKLSHLHFVCTEEARQRVLRMGEDPTMVHVTGCLSYDRYFKIQDNYSESLLSKYDTASKQFYIVMHHPNTENLQETLDEFKLLLEFMRTEKTRCFFFYPNIDPGNKSMITLFNNEIKLNPLQFTDSVTRVTNLPFDEFSILLKHAKFIVGNSSCGVREACIFGTPSVVLGNRQRGRRLPENTINFLGSDIEKFRRAINSHCKQLFEPCHMYGSGMAGEKMAAYLISISVSTIKHFHDN